MTDGLPILPDGWVLDPNVDQPEPGEGYCWAITPEGLRTAFNTAGHQCPACEGELAAMIECDTCAGRGHVDSIPWCPRPWDEVYENLWLGGVHCQESPECPDGDAHPQDRFDVVFSLFRNPKFDPAPGTQHIHFGIADADLDPAHHTRLDEMAEQVTHYAASGSRVLVRCKAGINRSALVVGLALLHEGWSVNEYLSHVRAVRSPYVLFNRSFVAYLREAEARG